MLSLNDLAYDPNTSTMYGINGNSSPLSLINLADGSTTFATGFGRSRFSAIAFDPNTNTHYGTGSNRDEGPFILNPGTGEITFIGAGSEVANALEFDTNTHTLYGGNLAGELFTIDVTDGTMSFVGSAGDYGVQDLAYDAGTSTMYGVSSSGVLLIVDTSSGVSTPVGNSNFPDGFTVTGLEFVSGGGGGSSTAVVVNNVDPTFEAGLDETLLPPVVGAFSRTGIAISDVGTLDTFTGTVDFGEGDGPETLVINQFTVTINADSIVEATEQFAANLSGLTGTNDVTVTNASSTATITDDDSASVSIARTNDANETGSASGKFTVTQSTTSSTDTVVSYSVLVGSTASNGGVDYTTLSGSVTILAADTTAVIDVDGIIDDSIVEADETMIVQLNSITSGDARISIGAANTATLKVLDNDTASRIINDVSQFEGDAPGTTVLAFTISIDPAGSGTTASQDITVMFNTSGVLATGGGVDCTDLVNQTVTIAAGTTRTTVMVNVKRENLAELDETFQVNLSNAKFNGAADATRVVIGDSTGIGTIKNDDFAPAANVGGPYVINEGSSLTVNASASSDADVSADTLTYRWDVDGDGDYDENVTGVNPTLTLTQLVALATASDARTASVVCGPVPICHDNTPILNGVFLLSPKSLDLGLNHGPLPNSDDFVGILLPSTRSSGVLR